METLLADPSKAERELGWRAETSFPELVSLMVESDLELQQKIHGIRLGSSGTR